MCVWGGGGRAKLEISIKFYFFSEILMYKI